MSSEIDVTTTLDVTGESCPMPVIKTRQATEDLVAEEVLEVLATDSGSLNDIDGWASATADVELLDQRERDELYLHYVRKTLEQ